MKQYNSDSYVATYHIIRAVINDLLYVAIATTVITIQLLDIQLNFNYIRIVELHNMDN